MKEKEPTSIFLVGMMASGKTTIGRHLAERLGWRFYDADHEIEARSGVSIPYIFEQEGEAGFRARETQMLAELTSLDGVVVATGGGAPMFEINRRLLARGLVIQLASSISDIIERTRHDTGRPLLAGEDRVDRIRKIMLERGPVYDEVCDEKVTTSRKAVETIVDKLLALDSVRAVRARCEARRKTQGEGN